MAQFSSPAMHSVFYCHWCLSLLRYFRAHSSELDGDLFFTPVSQNIKMATGAKKQDMPPQGGYRAIPFLRNPAKVYFSGMLM